MLRPHELSIFHLYIEDVGTGPPSGPEGVFEVCAEGAGPEQVSLTIPQWFRDDLKKLSSPASRNAHIIENVSSQLPLCERLGEFLFDSFVGSLPAVLAAYRSYLATNKKPRIALHIPSRLFSLPWELIRDPERPAKSFIALDGSVFRCYPAAKPNVYLDVAPQRLPLRLAYVISQPGDRQQFGISPQNLKTFPDLVRFDPINPATFYQLTQYTKGVLKRDPAGRPTGFVFFGHGEVDQTSGTPVGTVVFLQERPITRLLANWDSDPRSAHSMAQALHDCGMTLAIFCACETAWADDALSFENSIVGATLMGSETLAFVLGAQTEIDSFAATVGLSVLIEQVKDEPLDLALTEARRQIFYLQQRPGQLYSALDWWVPVLYSRTLNLELISKPVGEIRLPENSGTGNLSRGPGLPTNLGEVGDLARVLGRALATMLSDSPDTSANLFGNKL
jgi:hypothetical protein